MKRHIFKKAAVAVALTVSLAFVPTIGGCVGTNGRDGINGKDLTIYDIWQETKIQTDNPDLTYEEFLKEYLSFSGEDVQDATSLKYAINRSLMSGVCIKSTFDQHGYIYDELGRPQYVQYYSEGSGVIVDVDRQSGDMTVVTNCHVVYYNKKGTKDITRGELNARSGYAEKVELWFYGSEDEQASAIEAEIIGASKSYDIAVLKVSGSDLVKRSQAVAAQWISGEECYIGEAVYAVGNANGKKLSSSVGYISKDSEEVTVDLGSDSISETYTYRVLRTDAAINGGNSGGGLFNKYGELVGIVNAKTVSEEIDNMCYALPAATCKRVVQRLIADSDGKSGMELVSHGFECKSTDSYTTGLNAEGLAELKEVVTVTKVNAFTAAFWAGIKEGDVIKNVTVKRNNAVVEDMRIDRLHNFTDALISVQPNDTVTFTVERGSEETEVTMTYKITDFVSTK